MPSPLTIALALALAGQPITQPQPITAKGWAFSGRVVDQEDLHFGVRPALYVDGDGERDLGLTIQLSTKWL
jgi:hypothetical protein